MIWCFSLNCVIVVVVDDSTNNGKQHPDVQWLTASLMVIQHCGNVSFKKRKKTGARRGRRIFVIQGLHFQNIILILAFNSQTDYVEYSIASTRVRKQFTTLIMMGGILVVFLLFYDPSSA